MPTDARSPTLPRPKAKIDPDLTPFVGNETVADNLREAVEVSQDFPGLVNPLLQVHAEVRPADREPAVADPQRGERQAPQVEASAMLQIEHLCVVRLDVRPGQQQVA